MPGQQTKEQSATPWYGTVLIALIAVPALIIGLVPMLFRLWLRGRLRRRQERIWRRLEKERAGRPLLVNAKAPDTSTCPSHDDLRTLFHDEINPKLSYEHQNIMLRWLWYMREVPSRLYRLDRAAVFSVALKPMHDPPRTPFEINEPGAEFIFMGARRGEGWSFLEDAIPRDLWFDTFDKDTAFRSGYTSLIIMKQEACFPENLERLSLWEPVPDEKRLSAEEDKALREKPRWTEGRWVVLIDPTISKTRTGSNPWCWVSEHEDRQVAIDAARLFNEQHGVATCAARFERNIGWY